MVTSLSFVTIQVFIARWDMTHNHLWEHAKNWINNSSYFSLAHYVWWRQLEATSITRAEILHQRTKKVCFKSILVEIRSDCRDTPQSFRVLTHVCSHINMCIHAHTCTRTCTHTLTNKHTKSWTLAYTRMHAHRHAYYKNTQTHVHTHILLHIHRQSSNRCTVKQTDVSIQYLETLAHTSTNNILRLSHPKMVSIQQI